MKKVIAKIGAYILFYIGDGLSRLTMIKNCNGEFMFDKHETIGDFIVNLYEISMVSSLKMQLWGGADSPWKEPKKEEDVKSTIPISPDTTNNVSKGKI